MAIPTEPLAQQAAPRPAASCRAPRVSLFFDTLGQVRACCVNHQYALGHLASQRLAQIWRGPRAEALRQALDRGDFSLGCEHCRWQFDDGTAHLAHARKYDAYAPSAGGELWPTNMEFNLSNTCNLECPMCSGELSSAIRARRDRLPPLPKVYGDAFFEDLREFLPHLKTAQFLGGEPFLIREHFRVWDLMIEGGHPVRCEVTTNGTQFTAQVERVLDRLPVSINISLDGVRRATVETLRRNAQQDEILANYARFRDYCRQRGTSIGLNFSLMRQNWEEFGEFLEFAEADQVQVSVCTVVYPPAFSLYSLPSDELGRVVDALDRQDARIRPRLSVNLAVWDETRQKLRQRLAHAEGSQLAFVPSGLCDSFAEQASPGKEGGGLDRAVAELRAWSQGRSVEGVACDLNDRVRDMWNASQHFLGIPAELCLDRAADSVLGFARVRLGPQVEVLHWLGEASHLDRLLRFTSPAGKATLVRLWVLPRYEAGQLEGSLVLGAMRDQPEADSREPREA